MTPSTLVIRYPFRVRGVSSTGEHFTLDHLEVDLGTTGFALPTVRVEAEDVTPAQRVYLEAAAQSAAVQAFMQVAIRVSMEHQEVPPLGVQSPSALGPPPPYKRPQ